MKPSLSMLIIPFILTGCNDKIYDEVYYSAHLDEAIKVIEQCKARTVTDDNCKNAKSAVYKEHRKKMFSDLHRH
ncbi:EexN family lipoprotein [Salmonella enterica]|nr:EexN family lipoprotein [Salmonella enterica]